MIVEMKKIVVLCTQSNQDEMLESLRSLKVLHLDKIKETNNEKLELVSKKIDDIEKTKVILSSFKNNEFKNDKIDNLIEETLLLNNDLESFQNKEKQITDEIIRIEDFGDFNPKDVKQLVSQGIYVKLFKLNKKEKLNFPNDVFIRKIGNNKSDNFYISFSKNEFLKDIDGITLPENSLTELFSELEKTREKIEELKVKISNLSSYMNSLDKINDNAYDDYNFQSVKYGMESFDNILFLKGFIPKDRIAELKKAAEVKGWAYKISDVTSDDNPPTLLKNPKWVSPIKSALDIIAVLPGYKELDVSAVFLIFLSIFFAFIIGDAGYGILFLLTTLFAKFKFKQPKIKCGLNLLLIMSSCTVILGMLTGNYFGIPIENLPKSLQVLTNPFLTGWESTYSIWNKKIATNNIMFICFSIGLIHLSIARIWNFIRKINSLSCLIDLGWFFCSLSLYIFVLGLVIDPSWNWFVLINNYKLMVLALGSIFVFAGLLLTKAYIGIVTLFLDIISNFVDIISYIRLYAVGTASLEIALAFNKIALGSNLDNNLTFGAVLILFAGHTLNIILAVMGVMVHGIRLNTLEFSGHAGIEWAGISYKPFSRISKY